MGGGDVSEFESLLHSYIFVSLGGPVAYILQLYSDRRPYLTTVNTLLKAQGTTGIPKPSPTTFPTYIASYAILLLPHTPKISLILFNGNTITTWYFLWLDRYLQHMSHSGLVEFWHRSIVDKFRRSTGQVSDGVTSEQDTNLQALTLENLQGAFIVMGLGTFLSLSVLFFEILTDLCAWWASTAGWPLYLLYGWLASCIQ